MTWYQILGIGGTLLLMHHLLASHRQKILLLSQRNWVEAVLNRLDKHNKLMDENGHYLRDMGTWRKPQA